MRIVSLLPSATEIVFALGLGDELVGVTHECDCAARGGRHPGGDPQHARPLGPVVAGVSTGSSARLSTAARRLYELDEAALEAGRAGPHPHPGAVRRLRGELPPR